MRGCVCADTLGGSRWPVLRFDPISLVLAQRNGVEPPKKSAFLLRWLHHPRERSCLSCRYSSSPDLGAGLGGYLSAQISLTQSAVMLGLRARGRGGRDRTAAVAAPKSAFLWGSTPFLCARAKKWGGTGSRGHKLPPKKTAHPHQAPDQHQPLPKVGRGTSRPPTCSAHANGGDTKVKKRFSLAARHRFFGQAPKKWGRRAAGGSDHRPRKRRTRTKRKNKKGGQNLLR